MLWSSLLLAEQFDTLRPETKLSMALQQLYRISFIALYKECVPEM